MTEKDTGRRHREHLAKSQEEILEIYLAHPDVVRENNPHYEPTVAAIRARIEWLRGPLV